MHTLLFTLASLLVVFYIMCYRQPVAQVIATPIIRKVTPITQAQRDRLSMLACYSKAARAHKL